MKKEHTPGTMSRRTFVKAAMTVAGSGVLVSCAPKISDSAPDANPEGTTTQRANTASKLLLILFPTARSVKQKKRKSLLSERGPLVYAQQWLPLKKA